MDEWILVVQTVETGRGRERIRGDESDKEREKGREFGVFLTTLVSFLHTVWKFVYLVRKNLWPTLVMP